MSLPPRNTELHLQVQELFEVFFVNKVPRPGNVEICMTLAAPLATAYAAFRDAIEDADMFEARTGLLDKIEASRRQADAQIAAESAKCAATCRAIAAHEMRAQDELHRALEALCPHVATAMNPGISAGGIFATPDAGADNQLTPADSATAVALPSAGPVVIAPPTLDVPPSPIAAADTSTKSIVAKGKRSAAVGESGSSVVAKRKKL